MALKNLNKINKNLTKIYANKVTTNVASEENPETPETPANFIDRSEDLMKQMTFIAMTNKTFLNIA